MRARICEGRPAVEYGYRNEFGEAYKVLHVLDLDEARQLRDGLTNIIKECVVSEAVRLNQGTPTTLPSESVEQQAEKAFEEWYDSTQDQRDGPPTREACFTSGFMAGRASMGGAKEGAK